MHTPKHSSEGPVEHEIIENVKNFHKNQNPSPEEKRTEALGEDCDSSQFYVLLMVICLFQFQPSL